MEQVPTHADIMEKIERQEKKMEDWFIRLIASIVPLAIGAIIWSWSTHADQLAFNADVNARVQGNQETFKEARANQERIARQLEEIYRFMREDSKELREALGEHIRSNQDR